MKLPSEPTIRAVLATSYANDMIAYIDRRNARYQGRKQPTVGQVAKRFLMTCADVEACCEASKGRLAVSGFAYTAPAVQDGSFGPALLHAFFPQLAEDAPLSRRIVMVLVTTHQEPR